MVNNITNYISRPNNTNKNVIDKSKETIDGTGTSDNIYTDTKCSRQPWPRDRARHTDRTWSSSHTNAFLVLQFTSVLMTSGCGCAC